NRNTTVNNITYVNQRVGNGVTVVSHDAFVNARPASQNLMKVDQREIESARVTHVVSAEPVRASVMGSGRPAPVKPPSAVLTRPVVAVRTPPPVPRPIEQRQAESGGHLNEQALVRPVGPSHPAPVNQNERPQQNNERQPANQEGFRSFGQPNEAQSNVKPMLRSQPRVYEQQGSAPTENRTTENSTPQSENRMAQSENRPEPQQNRQFQPPQGSHPLVRPAPPVRTPSPEQEQRQQQKFNQWQQQRQSTPAPKPQPQPSRPAEARPSKH